MPIKYPKNDDLRRLVRFSENDGTIWLAENRMVLMHAAALAGLRKELIGSVGTEQARRILTRMGYECGIRDAELAMKIRGHQSLMDAFFVGPQLHMLEGSVRVTPVKLDMDIPTGKFYGEFIWENSWEAEAHFKEFGMQTEPSCWMQIGYASGYTTAFMGRFILYKEVECAVCGTDHCRIVGRPAEEWDDASDQARYYEPDSIIDRLIELHGQVDVLRSSLEQQHQTENLIGVSPAFQRSYDLMRKAADTCVTVLLTGETGVGKERFARALHDTSKRRQAPFVAVNCAALPCDLIESELFGVEKGAYTGAHAARAGRFERAEGGTIFLDEVGDLSLPAQAKLLRVIQEGELERLGDERTRKINVRIVTATNVDLHAAVKSGRFRSDLYYRLSVYPIHIAPLRERQLDIPPLVEAMLAKFCAIHGKRVTGLTDKAKKALQRYPWPGNVRELENIIERGVILTAPGAQMEVCDLFPVIDNTGSHESGIDHGGGLEDKLDTDGRSLFDAMIASGLSLDDFESMVLREAVNRTEGNLACAARMLGISRPKLNYRLKRNEQASE